VLKVKITTLPKANQSVLERNVRHFIRWHPSVEARISSFGSYMKLANNLAGEQNSVDYNELAKQLFATLQAHQAHYLVIGGYAARAYGVPRFTHDVDILIDDSKKNLQRILQALMELGCVAEIVYEMGGEIVKLLEIDDLPLKTDLMVNIPGIEFEDAWRRRAVHQLEDQTLYLISREDLITAKRAAGRWQDLEDVKALEFQ